MKLILSRKGFDSSAGGCPSPVFPDGSFHTLPIPDPGSRIAYRDIHHEGLNVGRLVASLSGDRRAGARKAHLDPDLIADVYPREPGWKPCLGQSGAAQGHLRKQSVGEGDLFLFFGLFRDVENTVEAGVSSKRPARFMACGDGCKWEACTGLMTCRVMSCPGHATTRIFMAGRTATIHSTWPPKSCSLASS